MTRNDLVTTEPESLGFDMTPMAAAAQTLVATRDPLMNYIKAVRAIPMGEQPIVVDGKVGSNYDVLAKKPQFKNALYEAIHRADGLDSNMSTLHYWATGSAALIVENINPHLETVRSILAAVPSGGAINPADLPRIREQMQIATVNVMLVRMAMKQITTGIRDFLAHFIIDHDTFAAGPLELRRMKDEVGRQISEDAMPLVVHPFYHGIGEAMLQVGRVFLAALDLLAQVLGNARTGHEAMDGAASALGTAAATAWTKYDAAATAVYASDSATMSVTLRKLQLTTAIESWKQFATFFSNSNL